jgi:phosphoribosylanthranilate isomerase
VRLAAGGATAGAMPLRVKICGVCAPGDAAHAIASGADYVGVIVAGPGPRAQGVAGAAVVFETVPPAARAGVFVDLPLEEVIAAAGALQLAVVQLHGSETPEDARAIARATGAAVWKVTHPADAADLDAAAARYGAAATGLLLDRASGGQPGGTGARFDWRSVAPARTLPRERGLDLIVAGGLTPNNVAEAVYVLRPDVVDVSSGVEAAVGRKSADGVVRFIEAAHGAARRLESE